MAEKTFDVAIIGSGPGGYTAALKAASLGKKVAVIEKDSIGGVCLNRGCIPTKAIIASVSLYTKMLKAGEYGIEAEAPRLNWAGILKRKQRVVSKLGKGIEFLFKKAGVELLKGTGSIKGTGCVSVENAGVTKEITCGDIIIATGTEKSILPGFRNAITSDEALELGDIPSSMAVIGAGAVGIEFASIFSALGTDITIYEMMPEILPNEDKDISSEISQILQKRNIKIITGQKADPEKISAAAVLLTGRKFKKIDVDTGMRTKEKGIYAIGDVTGMANYAHVASMQGIVAAENICGITSKMDYSAVPACTFTDPEIASVGLTEQKAGATGIEYSVSKFPFAALGKSACEGDIRGFVKLIIDKRTRTVIGCHIVGSHASDLIQEGVIAVKKKISCDELAKTIHAHPTMPEALWEAARSL